MLTFESRKETKFLINNIRKINKTNARAQKGAPQVTKHVKCVRYRSGTKHNNGQDKPKFSSYRITFIYNIYLVTFHWRWEYDIFLHNLLTY